MLPGLLGPEVDDTTLLQNAMNCRTNNTASHPRRFNLQKLCCEKL
jgi:hypothetical protein